MRALLGLGACVLIVSGTQSATAQGTISAQQSHVVTYGSSISFSVRGSSPDAVSDALLHIHLLDGTLTDVRPESFAGGTSFSASVTVPVAALKLTPFAQMSYQWELSTAVGNALTDLEGLLYEDTSLPWTWAVEGRDNFFVHTAGQNTELSQIALRAATEASARLTGITDVSPEIPIHIYIYPELSSLAGSLRRSQQRVQDWVAAYAIPGQGGIFVAAGSGEDIVPNLERDLAHELSHLYVYTAAGGDASKIPGWLNEGLALNASASPDTSLDDEMNTAIHDGVLLSMSDLCVPAFSALPPRDAALGYAQSASFVRYIDKRYGGSQIKALIAAYAGGASCADGVNSVLGTTLPDLETQWHGDLGQTYVEPIFQEFSLFPWVVAWVVSLLLAYLFVLPQPPAHEERPAYLTRHAVSPVPDVEQS
jgi:hypothetical protein